MKLSLKKYLDEGLKLDERRSPFFNKKQQGKNPPQHHTLPVKKPSRPLAYVYG